MTTAIKIENLSKVYRLGQIGTGTISRDLERWFVTKVMGREDPFLKVGQSNEAFAKTNNKYVWSLKDINLDIEQGDTVGIIGRNGAGKSTLLKLLSRITSPSAGSIKINGRVASLLEVGTGFHQELTGRENIYLNGSILGMRRREIDRRLDEIVDFSGIEEYIDTPVKRYSSGMYVRLAFSVAAHLESEILIVDEVLAVGDAGFQKKCLGKMGEIGKKHGRTVLFVSHNMSAVHSLCKKGVVLESGMLMFKGKVKESIGNYYQQIIASEAVDDSEEVSDHDARLFGIEVNQQPHPEVGTGESFEISIRVRGRDITGPVLFLIIENMTGQQVIHNRVFGDEINLGTIDGNHTLRLKLPALWLTPGVYSLYFKMLVPIGSNAGRVESERILLEVTGNADNSAKGVLLPKIEWNVEDSNGQNERKTRESLYAEK